MVVLVLQSVSDLGSSFHLIQRLARVRELSAEILTGHFDLPIADCLDEENESNLVTI